MSGAKLKPNEAISVREGAFYSIMVGAGETYLVAFALVLGVSEGGAALLAVLPIVGGSTIQLLSLRYVKGRSSAKRWVVGCSILQALSVVAFSFAILLPREPAVILNYLTVVSSIYWGAGQASGPAWNSWIAQIIDRNRIRQFFFRRNAVCQAFTLISLITAGITLDLTSSEGVLMLFVIIFTGSGTSRLISAYFMMRQPPEVESVTEELPARFRDWAKRPYFVHTMLFMLLTHSTVNVSAPFFSPYMLKELDLNFLAYAGLLAAMFLARMISGRLVQGYATRYGTHSLFVAGVVGIIPIPLLWVLSENYWYLVLLQIAAGVAWSCHELGLTLYLIETMPHRDRSRLLAWATTANSYGMLLGVLIGLAIVGGLGDIKTESYYLVFVISSLARIIPLLVVGKFLRSIDPQIIEFRILGLRPGGPSVLKPILWPVTRWRQRKPPNA